MNASLFIVTPIKNPNVGTIELVTEAKTEPDSRIRVRYKKYTNPPHIVPINERSAPIKIAASLFKAIS